MKKVANAIELRDAIRCEAKNISVTKGFTKVLRPFADYKENQADIQTITEEIEMPTFMALALDPKTVETLVKGYDFVMKDEERLELALGNVDA